MTEKQLFDAQLGTITLMVNPRARRIIMRATDGHLRVTLPHAMSAPAVLRSLQPYRERLLQMLANSRQRTPVIHFGYRIDTDLLHLWLTPTPRTGFYINRRTGSCELVCPADTDFTALQERLQNAIREQLRHQAKAILPQRVANLAIKHHFQYGTLRIQSSRTRWGSCSPTGDINLTLYLMKLPSHLVDYVILHELCHTIHHDHSPAFWTLMEQVTQGQSASLRQELRRHSTDLTPYVEDLLPEKDI